MQLFFNSLENEPVSVSPSVSHQEVYTTVETNKLAQTFTNYICS